MRFYSRVEFVSFLSHFSSKKKKKMNDGLELYSRKLNEAMEQLEKEAVKWRKKQKQLESTLECIQSMKNSYRTSVLVPLLNDETPGSMAVAYMEGYVYNASDSLLIALDSNGIDHSGRWFAETHVSQVERVLTSRIRSCESQIETSVKLSDDLLVRKQQMHQLDGTQVNEEGLEIVEINEEYNSHPSSDCSASSHSHGSVDGFDNRLLKRIEELEALEMEENGSGRESSRESGESDSQSLAVKSQVVERLFNDTDDSSDSSDSSECLTQFSKAYSRKRQELIAANLLTARQ